MTDPDDRARLELRCDDELEPWRPPEVVDERSAVVVGLVAAGIVGFLVGFLVGIVSAR